MAKKRKGYRQTEIKKLIENAYDLFSDIIKATKPSDVRAKKQKVEWWNRHRLHVLLDVANENVEKSSNNTIVAPWFVVELKATNEIVNQWKKNPIWREIEPSLKNKDHFTHTIGKLRVAEHFVRSGHKTEIVPRDQNASPDLRIQAKGGTQDWLYVECYQPNAFTGNPMKISDEVMNRVIKRSMAKAKRQFAERTPGILAIIVYNQNNITIQLLEQKITRRLDETDRSYLAGFILLHQYVYLKSFKKRISFTPKIYANFISNPTYFDRVDIIVESEKNENAKAISTPRKIKRIALSIIEEPAPLSRIIFRNKQGKVSPLFDGKGNIDYVCGKCQAILANHVWKLSLGNIVIFCSSCNSFNDIPRIPELNYPVKGTIAIEKETYFLNQPINLKQGATIFGL